MKCYTSESMDECIKMAPVTVIFIRLISRMYKWKSKIILMYFFKVGLVLKYLMFITVVKL